ncbi:hypothetical protein B0H12DRAFT_257101 [Mycena haematopus]|nr:hypothetical protein B0H12DRAFT_257101 [Mycena haematopus]
MDSEFLLLSPIEPFSLGPLTTCFLLRHPILHTGIAGGLPASVKSWPRDVRDRTQTGKSNVGPVLINPTWIQTVDEISLIGREDRWGKKLPSAELFLAYSCAFLVL